MRALQFMWDGGETRRYHGFRMLMEDTVGHHSYNVACIIMYVRPDASAKLLRAALKHDMAEHRVGDMPAPTKRDLPDYVELDNQHDLVRGRVAMVVDLVSFRQIFGDYETVKAAEYDVDLEQDLSPEEAWVLKFADSLDGMRFCANERALGNKTRRLEECYEAFDSYVADLLFIKEKPTRILHPNEVAQLAELTPYATDIDRDVFLYVRRQWSSIR